MWRPMWRSCAPWSRANGIVPTLVTRFVKTSNECGLLFLVQKVWKVFRIYPNFSESLKFDYQLVAPGHGVYNIGSSLDYRFSTNLLSWESIHNACPWAGIADPLALLSVKWCLCNQSLAEAWLEVHWYQAYLVRGERYS